MIRVSISNFPGEVPVRLSACCDRCGCEAPGSIRFEDTQWDRGYAVAAARGAGFVERIEGRVSRLYCPECSEVSE